MKSLSKGGEVMWEFLGGNFFLLKRGRSFLLDFWAQCVRLYEVCFLPLLFLFFQTPKYFWWVCQCVHQGGDCKVKVCLILIPWWTISIWDYWFWYLEIISEVVFGDDWICMWWTGIAYCRVRSDRVVVAGQTDVYRAVRPASPRSEQSTSIRG